MPKDQKIADHQINHESSIITSDSNKDLKKRIVHYELSAYFFGDPGGIRTPDPRLRRPLLYPTELLNHVDYLYM